VVPSVGAGDVGEMRVMQTVHGPDEDDRAAAQRWSTDLARASDPFHDAVVLVIDDNEVNLALLDRILRGAGVAEVHCIQDPLLAVERCRVLGPDLVLLDLHMPHLDGFGVLQALQAELAPDDFLPVIVLTGDATDTTRVRALDAGAKDFLTKPFDRIEVLQRARNLLQTRALYEGIQRDRRRLEAALERELEAQRRLEAERALRRERVADVLERGALHMVFQPIVALTTGRTIGVEALARFDAEPQRTPDLWFDEAAGVGLGVDLELAAISAALAQVDALPPGLLLSVNASPAAAMDPRFVEVLRPFASPQLVLELTEHQRVADYGALLAAIGDLRAEGVKIAVDDAGAGYAGLQQILDLQPEVIKLDLALTRGVDVDPVRRSLAAALVTFAGETGATLIAEGIETAGELTALQDLGVHWGQGYHLARPAPPPVVEEVAVVRARDDG
jgi:EAL domain-containing protein (putative c-di-GMP-specific phosphodiesterase class I)